MLFYNTKVDKNIESANLTLFKKQVCNIVNILKIKEIRAFVTKCCNVVLLNCNMLQHEIFVFKSLRIKYDLLQNE